MFAYKEPEMKEGNLFAAFLDIKSQIEEVGIITSDINDAEQITYFVKQV